MCLKGKLESQAPQLLKVHGFLFISSSFRWFSKCAMFHPNKEAKVIIMYKKLIANRILL